MTDSFSLSPVYATQSGSSQEVAQMSAWHPSVWLSGLIDLGCRGLVLATKVTAALEAEEAAAREAQVSLCLLPYGPTALCTYHTCELGWTGLVDSW